MTIAIETNQFNLIGDGVSTEITITNQVFAEADLIVNVTEIATGLQTAQVLDVDYTVAIAADRTAVVTMLAPPAVGFTAVAVVDTPAVYSDVFDPRKSFSDGKLNDTLDRIYRAQHRTTSQLSRTFRLGDGDPATSMAPAATLTSFYGKLIAIDLAGNPIPGPSVANLALTITKDLLDGDDATVAFPLSAAPASTEATAVFITGVRQVPGTDYTVSGSTLTFTSAPPTGTGNIFVLAGQSFAGVPSDGSVTLAKMAADAIDWDAALKHQTAGDLPYYGASGVPALLAKGADGAALELVAGLPAWVANTNYPPGFIFGCVPSNAADADHHIAFTSGFASLLAGGLNITLPAYTKQFDAAFAEGDAAGGLGNTVTLPTSGTLHVFAITKDADGSVDYYGDTSFAGANVPTGWTVRRRVGSFKTDGSDNFLPFSARELGGGSLEILWNAVQLDYSAAPGVTTAFTVTLTLPSGLKVTALNTLGVSSVGVGGSTNVRLSPLDVSDQASSITTGTATWGLGGSGDDSQSASDTKRTRANASAQIRARMSVSKTLYIATEGFIDDRAV